MKKKLLLLFMLFAFAFTFAGCEKNVDESSLELFDKFENGEISVKCSENFELNDNMYIEAKIEGTIDDFKNYLADQIYEGEVEFTVYKTPVKFDNGYDHCQFMICSDFDYSMMILLKNNNGTLEVAYEDLQWSRKSITFYRNGLIMSSGSNGAGSHVALLYYLDETGKVSNVYYYSSDNIYWTLCNYDKLQDYEQNEDDFNFLDRIFVDTYRIDDEVYQTLIVYDLNFELWNNKEDVKRAEEVLEHAEFRAEGTMISENELNEIVDERLKEFNVKMDFNKAIY